MTPTPKEDECGIMILTPNELHNGGMWCAEKKPCRIHSPSPTEGLEWEEEYEKMFDFDMCEECGNFKCGRTSNKAIKSFISRTLSAALERRTAEIREVLERVIEAWHNRHDRCIGTDGYIPDAQWTGLLSDVMKMGYEEDSKAFQALLSSPLLTPKDTKKTQ